MFMIDKPSSPLNGECDEVSIESVINDTASAHGVIRCVVS